MKIYLACTVRGDRTALPVLRDVVARLEQRGHQVLTAHLLRDDVEQVESRLSEREVYERDIRWLDACDILVADASGSSYGVGFEVGYVLARAPLTGQRVFVVYDQRRRGAISRMVSGNSHPSCVTHAYADVDSLAAFIDRHVSAFGT